MRICFISKYPPIEGGISSATYWLAKRLGEGGIEIHVVTNAFEVENEFREKLNPDDPEFTHENVKVHSTSPLPSLKANPSHIPFSRMYCEKLASLAIEVIEENDIQVIDSWYLIPYCVSGYLAKSFTDIPQIIRHAGSDLQRLYPSPYLQRLLRKVIKSADGIITNQLTANFFKNLGVSSSKIFHTQPLYVDTTAFNPDVAPFNLEPCITNQNYYPGIPIIAYIGKITHHFETKGLPELLKACSIIKEEFLLLFVSNGKKLAEFKTLVEKANLKEKTCFLPFLPPWQIPSLLRACTCIVALENKSSPTLRYHVPNVPAEAMATGRCVLMSEELHEKETYKKLESGKEVLVVKATNINKIKETLEQIIKNYSLADEIGKNAHEAILQNKSLQKHYDDTIGFYKSLLALNRVSKFNLA